MIALEYVQKLAIISFTKHDAKILTKRLKVRTYGSNALLQSYDIQPAPLNKPCISLRVFLFLSYWVSLGEYIQVLMVYPTILQVRFSSYGRGWLTTGGLGNSIFISHLYAFIRGCHLC